jgi:hypothetical protein
MPSLALYNDFMAVFGCGMPLGPQTGFMIRAQMTARVTNSQLCLQLSVQEFVSLATFSPLQ